MSHRLATIALGPLLLAQGLHVRRVTPRLSEPPGDRDGSAGAGPPLRVLIAGDSAAAGVGATTQAEGLSGQLVKSLAADFRLSWKLIARTGNAIRDAIAQLEEEPPEDFDFAVISIGVNDVTGGTGRADWSKREARLVDLLSSRFGVGRVLLSAIPPMQQFPALPQPLAWYLGRRAALLNDLSRDWAASSERCEFVEPPFRFEAGAIAPDGFHPGPAAYALWASHLADRIRQCFEPGRFPEAPAGREILSAAP